MEPTLLRCPVCSSEELSREFGYSAFEDHARLPGSGKSLLGSGDTTFAATRARICLGCGFLMTFVAGSDLRKLRIIED